jgi:hypothetical protein
VELSYTPSILPLLSFPSFLLTSLSPGLIDRYVPLQVLPNPEGWQAGEGPSWPQEPLISQDRGKTQCGSLGNWVGSLQDSE